MKLVLSFAKAYNNKGVEFEDLVQEGVIGLYNAIEHYNVSVNVGFSKYASWWIFQAISQALLTIPQRVKLPLNMITLHRKVWTFANKYEQTQGYYPSINDIEIDDIDNYEGIKSVYQLPADLKEVTLLVDNFDSYENSQKQMDDYEEKDYCIYNANKLLNRLEEKEQLIIRLFYGIGTETKTLDSIGNYLGLSRERVRQIALRAIERMRDLLEHKDVVVEVEKDQRIIKSFKEAKIGDFVKVPPNSLFGKVIDIQKSTVYGRIFVLKTEDGIINKYNINGELINIEKKKVPKMTPEREAFIKDFYSDNNTKSIRNNKLKTDLHQSVKQDHPQSKRVYNTNVISRNQNTAKIGDRILYDSNYYTVIEKRSMGGFPRLIVRCDDGTLDNLPNDRTKYIVIDDK